MFLLARQNNYGVAYQNIHIQLKKRLLCIVLSLSNYKRNEWNVCYSVKYALTYFKVPVPMLCQYIEAASLNSSC